MAEPDEVRYRNATVGWICVDCGAYVGLPDTHDDWHTRLDHMEVQA